MINSVVKHNTQHPRLSDVFCSDKFKKELDDIVLSILNKNLYLVFGARPPQTFLFSGSPGTGKTYVTKAIVNEISSSLDTLVAMFEYNIGDVGTAYINMGSVNLQGIFNKGLKLITDEDNMFSHVFYFFDEADAIMSHRGGRNSHKEDDKMLETLMKNLQRISDRGNNEYVIFATNFEDALDKASIRTGRIDYRLAFELPDYESRLRLFEGYINITNKIVGYKLFRDYDLKELAKISDGFSCSDISATVNLTVNDKIKKELRRKVKGIITAYWIPGKSIIDSVYAMKRMLNKSNKKKIGFI